MDLVTKRKIVVVLSIMAVVVIVFLIVSLILFNSLKTNSNKFLEIQKSLAALDVIRNQFNVYKNKFEQNEKDFSKINNLFLSKSEVLKFFNFLETNAKDYKSYINISVLNRDEGEDFLKIQISLHGNFENFMRFLNRLENAPYLIEIEDFKLRRLTLAEIMAWAKQMPALQEGDINSILILKVYTRQ